MFIRKILICLIVPFMFLDLFPGPDYTPAGSGQPGQAAETVLQIQQSMQEKNASSGTMPKKTWDDACQAMAALQMGHPLLPGGGLIGNRIRQASPPASMIVAGQGPQDGTRVQAHADSPAVAPAKDRPDTRAQVKVAGKAAAPPAPSRGSSGSGDRIVTMVSTGYDGCYQCNKPYYGKPSYIGLPLARGIAAVDPDVIPMGTRLYVEGYGSAIAADQGGAIRGNRIDLFFDSHQEALKWGKKTVKVTILGQ